MSSTNQSGTRPRARGRTRTLTAAVVALAVVAGTAATAMHGAAAVAPTTDPVAASQYAARWTAAQVVPAGYVPGPTNNPNVSATLETAVGLALTGVENPTFMAIVAWSQANVQLAIDPDGLGDSPGNLGYLLMLAKAADVDPTNYGGQNLVTRLDATLDAFAPGLYGATDPTYDGVFRQSLALLGLESVGAPLPAAAVAWLAGQQCDATGPAAAGGFEPYRADTAVACVSPDPVAFVGPDTNSTAMAIQALVGTGSFPALPEAMDFLAAAESSAGGFAFMPGGEVDPNSTSLVIQAILAGGEDPGVGRWVQGASTPITSLLSWQLDCAALTTDLGAFASPFSQGAADGVATRQAVWGTSGRAFPITSAPVWSAAPAPCVVAATTTTTSTTVSSTTTTTTLSTGLLGAGAVTPAAAPVTAVPAFTG